MQTFALDVFQKRVAKWQAHNFPNSLPHQPLLGVVEELGELMSATNFEDWQDAIGDIVVYLSDYCNRNDFNMNACFINSYPKLDLSNPYKGLSIVVGKLSHAHLKREQNIRRSETHELAQVAGIGGILHYIQLLCSDWMTVSEKVFEKVEKRDWIKYPTDGKSN